MRLVRSATEASNVEIWARTGSLTKVAVGDTSPDDYL